MSEIIFQVQGSEPTPYKVTFEKDGQIVRAYCTCAAGSKGQYCKHRFAILAGNIGNLVSNNTSDVSTVRGWLAGSNIESALLEVEEAERLVDTAGKTFSNAKKRLAQAFRGAV